MEIESNVKTSNKKPTIIAKGDSIFIFIIICLMLAIAANAVIEIIQHTNKDTSAFEVKMVEDNWGGKYCLFIEGENYMPVNYNVYMYVDENGDTNPKMCLIIHELGIAVNAVMMGFIFLLSYFVLKNSIEQGTPFIKKNVTILRIIAVMTMLVAIIPECIKMITMLVVFNKGTVNFTQVNFFVLIVGVLIGVISEIFHYGYKLQEEMDQIA